MQWNIYNEASEVKSCSNSKKYNDSSTYVETCCARTYKNILKCLDTGNNGWKGGYLTINGEVYCNNSAWFTNAGETTYQLDLKGRRIIS